MTAESHSANRGSIPRGSIESPRFSAGFFYCGHWFHPQFHHLSNHGPFSDERINFPAKFLRAGQNTIMIQMDARKLTAYLMLDYLRLELSGYVPPAPARVTAYAGNNRALICWPLVPGATSYTLLRSTSHDGQYVPVAAGFIAPACGSGPSAAQYVDATASNGGEYFYKVQSVNPAGLSEPSRPSAATKPSTVQSGDVPPTPVDIKVVASAHRRVALTWAASPGASFYRIWRSTLHADGVGGNYPVGRVLLVDGLAAITFTDTSPTDGRDYSYRAEAVSPAGVSAKALMFCDSLTERWRGRMGDILRSRGDVPHIGGITAGLGGAEMRRPD
jgi:hypothetical protein